ncbi:hypothetical protein Y032_0211g2179 [Ancylostoma ceylanicum]|uniref:Uncharacterized protein n=1 Tax=Ancylostoma ceylanicum TaxID=53326 RepID=A0A016SKX9_9BILA|nr:hypothetical protein Y032_0211g2179 [Ancylostoma ceylanicum]
MDSPGHLAMHLSRMLIYQIWDAAQMFNTDAYLMEINKPDGKRDKDSDKNNTSVISHKLDAVVMQAVLWL